MAQHPPVVDFDEAVTAITPGDHVYLHEVAMTPIELVDSLANRVLRGALDDVHTVSLHTEGPAPHVNPELAGRLRHIALFIGKNVREAVNDGRADYTPVFLSDVPGLIANRSVPVDVALLQVSPPDRHGFCRLGTSIACARAALEHSRTAIGLINPQVPRTMGNSAVHASEFDMLAEANRPLPVLAPATIAPVERRIGELVASLIPDGATLQMGIGAIPNAVLASLAGHHDLGVHTEMLSDGVLDLVESGVITNRLKNTWKGRMVTSFALGSQRLYDFLDDNPFVEFHTTDIVNDTREIRRIDRMMAVNSAIEVDLTGQIVADSIGTRMYSGIGGQMDFARGAALSREGKAIFAFPSTAMGGQQSRIVSLLQPGAGVVTTRGHVQYIVTEFGIAPMVGKSLRQRAEALIAIAHPDFRTELTAAAVSRRLFAVSSRTR